MSHEGYDKHGFNMKLNSGMAEEHKRHHDEIFLELVDLLHEAGVADYSTFLDEETSTLFRVMWGQQRIPCLA